MAVVELNHLSKWYGEVIGLNDVTLAIEGGITGLVGPNGAGKSTLMGLTMGQLRPSRGSIRVFGKGVWDNPRVLSRLGYCPEGDPFWPSLTGRRFVVFLARASGLSLREARRAADRAIELTGMTEHADRAIRGYSKGMRQRIKLAQTLAHSPELLVLDEPFTGADPVGRHELANLFRHLADEGIDILVSSHVLHEVESLTREIVMIDHGRVVAQGDTRRVRRDMHDRLHAIRVRLAGGSGSSDRDDSGVRRLAVRLAAVKSVAGLKVVSADTLVVETAVPDQVYDGLPGWVLEENVAVREIAAADDNLEAVFGYLTQQNP